MQDIKIGVQIKNLSFTRLYPVDWNKPYLEKNKYLIKYNDLTQKGVYDQIFFMFYEDDNIVGLTESGSLIDYKRVCRYKHLQNDTDIYTYVSIKDVIENIIDIFYNTKRMLI